jgi:nitrate reductase NapAB chaperone NapD
MPVSGLVVSFSDQPDLREKAMDAIRDDSRIEIGVTKSQRMAIVIDTPSSDEDKQLWGWLNSLPGVVFVDVVMVGFEESTASGSSMLSSSQT